MNVGGIKYLLKMEKLYLDDVRVPRHSYPAMSRVGGINASVYQNDDWNIVRNYDEFDKEPKCRNKPNALSPPLGPCKPCGFRSLFHTITLRQLPCFERQLTSRYSSAVKQRNGGSRYGARPCKS